MVEKFLSYYGIAGWLAGCLSGCLKSPQLAVVKIWLLASSYYKISTLTFDKSQPPRVKNSQRVCVFCSGSTIKSDDHSGVGAFQVSNQEVE